MPPKMNLAGQRFDKFTVVKEVGKTSNGVAVWEAVCDCGTVVYRTAWRLRCKKKMLCRKCYVSNPVERFWTHVVKRGLEECWEWQGYLSKKGYGKIVVTARKILVHRYSWLIHNGDIPEGLFVLHKCDNPKCVNPDHLFIGTQDDNMKDMQSKLRGVYGMDNGSGRISTEIVAEIRAMGHSVSQNTIAKMYGVSQSHVWNILNNKKRIVK